MPAADALSDNEWDFAVFLAGVRPSDARKERWKTPRELERQRMYDMQTEAHRALLRHNQKETAA